MTFDPTPQESHPLLDRVLVAMRCRGFLQRPLVVKLADGVEQHQDTQSQDAGQDHGQGVDF